MAPKISIVLPCYNIENYLERCIKSIESQTFTDFEALFINDGSTDETVETFKKIKPDSRFKMFSKINEGSGFARNYGLEKAQGQYLYFMDPDDLIDQDLLEVNLEYMEKYDADLNIFGLRKVEESTGKEVVSTPPQELILEPGAQIKKRLPEVSKSVNISAVWNKFYKHHFLKEHNLKFTNLPVGQDYEFNWNIYDKAEKMVIIPNALYSYHVNRPGSVRTEYNSNQYVSEKIILETMINKSVKWDREEEYAEIINNYKVYIVFGEIINLKKADRNAIDILKEDSLYTSVKNMGYTSKTNRLNKAKLILIKNEFLLKLFLRNYNIMPDIFKK